MVKLLLNFAQNVLSKEQMKAVKGGNFGTCPSGSYAYTCRSQWYGYQSNGQIDYNNPQGSISGTVCAATDHDAVVAQQWTLQQQGVFQQGMDITCS